MAIVESKEEKKKQKFMIEYTEEEPV